MVAEIQGQHKLAAAEKRSIVADMGDIVVRWPAL